MSTYYRVGPLVNILLLQEVYFIEITAWLLCYFFSFNLILSFCAINTKMSNFGGTRVLNNTVLWVLVKRMLKLFLSAKMIMLCNRNRIANCIPHVYDSNINLFKSIGNFFRSMLNALMLSEINSGVYT